MGNSDFFFLKNPLRCSGFYNGKKLWFISSYGWYNVMNEIFPLSSHNVKYMSQLFHVLSLRWAIILIIFHGNLFV